MKTVIIGASDSALEVYEILLKLNRPHPIYFYDEDISRVGTTWGHSTIIDIKNNGPYTAVMGVGGKPHKQFILRTRNYIKNWFTVIHPDTSISKDSIISDACTVQQKVVLMPYTKIGNFVYLNVGVLIGHHAQIGNYSTISPYAKVLGRVVIGEECMIGCGAIIKEKIKIANRVTIGAGAVVIKDITESDTTWVGIPARRIK
jgi:sugar O-acyltransferase (sialic acid O-acetyltransferase NeuD family)